MQTKYELGPKTFPGGAGRGGGGEQEREQGQLSSSFFFFFLTLLHSNLLSFIPRHVSQYKKRSKTRGGLVKITEKKGESVQRSIEKMGVHFWQQQARRV